MFHAFRIPQECVRVTFLLISSSLRPLHPLAFYNILSSDFLSRGKYFTRPKLSSPVYLAWKMFLFRKCVHVWLLCIQRRCLPLPRLAFSYVTQLRFQSRDARSRLTFKWHPGCSTRVEYLKSACASHFCCYQVVFVQSILWHFIISLAQIFYQQVHISRAQKFPRANTSREKYFFLESACMCNSCVYNVGVFHCLVLRFAIGHSCVFSQQMHGFASHLNDIPGVPRV